VVAAASLAGGVTALGEAGAASREIGNGLGVAAAAGALSIPLTYSTARLLAGGGRGSSMLWLATLAPLALPAPLIGIGLVSLWNRPAGAAVYGSAAMPVLAALARFAPLAALLGAAFIRRLDPALEEAARVFSPRLPALARVSLPLLRPGLLAAGGVVFALTLGEIGATLIVIPPGMQTLSIRIYNYLHYGATETVSALCLVAAALSLGGAALLWRMVRP